MTNLVKNDPTLKDVLDLLKKDIFLSLNCHAVGTIQSFDSAKQTAQITINYAKSKYVLDNDENYILQAQNYPLLLDCPVMFLGDGQSAGMTSPIKSGATCLVLFNDRDIDHWFATGDTKSPPDTQRAHAMSDAIALIGLRSSVNPIPNFDADRQVMYYGDTKVALSETKAEISNATENLYEILSDLITAIQSITTSNAVPGVPCTISTASQAQLALINTRLGELLE